MAWGWKEYLNKLLRVGELRPYPYLQVMLE